MSLAEFLNELEEHDEEMSKEAQELEKLAAEEEAAGRIMARGFMDELNKLGQDMKFKPEPVSRSEASLAKQQGRKVRTPSAPPEPPQGSVVNPGRLAGTKAVQKRQQKTFR